MTVLAAYQDAVVRKLIVPDQAQQNVVQALDHIHQQLVEKVQQTSSILYPVHKYFIKPTVVKGLYVWGGVGIGKTYLLDLFFRELPFKQKLRTHFHSFMRDIHHQLTKRQGEKNPLQKIATEIAKQYLVLCFDEFFVNDIGDAMLLGNLFKALFDHGVTIVTTSNVAPDQLYLNGLQRELFLPAIAAIKTNMSELHLASQTDYRQSPLLTRYYFPLTDFVADKMQEIFVALAKSTGKTIPIQINQRLITTVAWADNVIWCDFDALCQVPRSQDDYLDIASQFQTVLLSNVPQIKAYQHHLITYFINLVDVLYDQKTQLFISSAVPMHEIYPRGRKAFEFQRTQSRLQEMQT